MIDTYISNIYLTFNMLLWLVAFLIYQRRRKNFGAGSVLLLYYLSMAVTSIFLFNNPLYKGDYNTITLLPIIYLFVTLMFATWPVLQYKEQEFENIQQPSRWAFGALCVFIILSAILQIPTIIESFSTGFVNLLVDDTAGKDLYSENLASYEDSNDGVIANLLSIFTNLFTELSVLFLFYYLTLKNRKKWLVLGLAFVALLAVIYSVTSGQRGTTVLLIFTIIIAFFALRNHLQKRTRKVITVIGIVAIVIISIPIVAITVSRFGNNSNHTSLSSVELYYGQAFINFNNYGLDANGIRYGDRTASLFKQMIWSDVPKNYLERRAKYENMKMDESVFYTFIGDFTLDYGPIITFFIFLFWLILFTRKTRVQGKTILFHQLIAIYFVMCVCVQGGMCLFTFADVGGNLKILTFILTYFYFKLDYMIQNKLIKF